MDKSEHHARPSRSTSSCADETAGKLKVHIESIAGKDANKSIQDMEDYHRELENQNRNLRQAMIELENSFKKYWNYYDSAPVGYFTLDRNHVIQEVNQTGAQFLGTEKGKLIGTPLTRYITSEDVNRFQVHMQQVFNEETNKVCELGFVKSNTTLFYARMESALLHDYKENTALCHSIVSDITKHKQAREQIKNLARFPFENPNPVLRIAKDGTLLYANTASKFLLHEWSCQSNQSVPERWQQITLKAHTSKSTQAFEAEYAGRIFSFLVVPVADADYVNIYGRDVTESKQAKESLERELVVNTALSRLYEPLILSSSTIEDIAHIILNQAKKLTDSRHGFVASIDPENGNHIAHTLTEVLENQCTVSEEKKQIVFKPKSNGLYPTLWGHSLNTHESFYTNDPQNHPASSGIPDGHISIDRFLSVPVMLGTELVGHIALANPPRDYTNCDLEATERLAKLYALAIQRMRIETALREAHDKLEKRVEERTSELLLVNEQLKHEILEHKRAEEEKIKLEKQLQQIQKMEAIGQLTSGLAHDLKNMLNVILGQAEYARKMLGFNPEIHEILDTIQQAGHQASEVTQSLLTFSRTLPAQKKPVKLNEIVDGVSKLLRSMLPASIQLILDEIITDPPIWINADSTQLEQVIINLAINARDAMPSGGILSISVTPENLDPSERTGLLTESGTRYVRLAICDTGTGIPPEIQSRIFEPFFSTKPRDKGMGLGLATAHGIIQNHDGVIEVQSKPGTGSKFSIILPQISPHTDSFSIHKSSVIPRGHGEMILLAEQHPYIRKIIGSTLSTHGYEVLQASDRNTLNRMYQQNCQELKLMIVDAYLYTRVIELALAVQAEQKQVPCILMTDGNDNDEVQSDSLSNIYKISKPFQMGELGKLIGDVFGPDSRGEMPS